jgi:hypothetical protein
MGDGQDVAKPELVIFSSGKVVDSGVTDTIRDVSFTLPAVGLTLA